MGQVSAASTVLINAAPDAVLAAVSDYQTVRPKILPSQYSDYQVLQGGTGAGIGSITYGQTYPSATARERG